MKSIWLVFLGLLSTPVAADSFEFSISPTATPAALDQAMTQLASRAIARYRDDDHRRYLDGLFRLQLVAGRYADAAKTLGELRDRRAADRSPGMVAKDLQYAIYLQAKAIEAATKISFDEAFTRAFRETLGRLDDPVSALLVRAMSHYSAGISLHAPIEENLQTALSRQKGKSEIASDEAVALLRLYSVAKSFRAFSPLVDKLIAEDDQRRYSIEETLVSTPNEGAVCATIVRPRNSPRLPTLFEFTVYADPAVMLSEARRTASRGYVGVEGLTRGKGCSPNTPLAYEHDGEDAAALIDWISHQTWSDGRVGMFGASYTGFTTWAALKHRSPALKAAMDSVTNVPGVDTPMEGSIFNSFVYYWHFYTQSNKTLDEAALTDRAHWRELFRKWYLSGAAYRTMDQMDGRPNPHWDRMLEHPDYDDYWQAMVPFAEEFARIDIPVLTTTGYYDGGEIGALYMLNQHVKYKPNAEHYLVIGPYDHHTGNRGTVDVLGEQATELSGYPLDPNALIDMGELRYQWFDYLFKGAKKPASLQDKINFEVMGANRWQHAPSIAKMAPSHLRLHLSDGKAGEFYRLEERDPGDGKFVNQSLDLKDRSDVDRVSPASGGIIDSVIDTYNSVLFESAPFSKTTDISGLFAGHLDVVTNKKDFDFQVQLYEHTADGKYFELSWYTQRASYVADRTRRQLLTPGVLQRLLFTSGRLTSRRLEPGSRIVVQLSLLKSADSQINYGSGKEVSSETIADAGTPLQVKWYGSSTIDFPISRGTP